MIDEIKTKDDVIEYLVANFPDDSICKVIVKKLTLNEVIAIEEKQNLSDFLKMRAESFDELVGEYERTGTAIRAAIKPAHDLQLVNQRHNYQRIIQIVNKYGLRGEDK